MVKTGRLLAALALLAALPQAAQAQGCNISYRLWQDGNNTYYNHGEIIYLEVGEKADLYVHGPRSRSADPYSAAADIGAPTAFGVGGQRPQDVNRVLRLGNHDPRKGKISFTTSAAGETALGYRITDVVRPGRLEDIPANCRKGQVRITVRRAARGKPAPPPSGPAVGSSNEATHALLVQLYQGILRRDAREAATYPDSFFDQVQREGMRGLISVAQTMTSSPEFSNGALTRTRQSLKASGVAAGNLSQGVVADQLLTDICQTLYGNHAPETYTRNLMASKLNSCLSGNAALCRQLGTDLLAQRQYYEHNRAHLDYLPR